MLTVVLDPIISFSLSITYQASTQSETYHCNDCFWKLSWFSQNTTEMTQIGVFLKITRESKHIPGIKSLRCSQKSAVIINTLPQPWLEQISFKTCWDWLIMQIKFLPVKPIARIALFFFLFFFFFSSPNTSRETNTIYVIYILFQGLGGGFFLWHQNERLMSPFKRG